MTVFLSSEEIEVMENFAKIHPSLIIRDKSYNFFDTYTPGKDLYGLYRYSESSQLSSVMKTPWPIYDIGSFLNVVKSLSGDKCSILSNDDGTWIFLTLLLLSYMDLLLSRYYHIPEKKRNKME